MNLLRSLPLLVASALPLTAFAQNFQESFDSYSSLFNGVNPWAVQNRSDSPAGGQSWFAGDTAILPAQSGTGYVAANYFSTGGLTGTETVSNWLFSPVLNLVNGGTVTFFTRSAGGAPDHLEIRLSLSGVSTNVGATSTSFGDFSVLLTDINPLLGPGGVTGYPTGWTQFTAIIAGVPVGGTTGRLGFRYTIPNSGLNGVNGDYIGVDNLTSTLTVVPEPSTYAICAVGLAAGGLLVARRRRVAQAA